MADIGSCIINHYNGMCNKQTQKESIGVKQLFPHIIIEILGLSRSYKSAKNDILCMLDRKSKY